MKAMSSAAPLLNQIETDQNDDFTPAQIERFRRDPELLKKFTTALEDDANNKFGITLVRTSPQQQWATAKVREFMTAMLEGDEKLCQVLIPTFPVGCRRLTPAPGYLESMRAPNVEVVAHGIRRFVAEGLELETGEVIKVDAIICATGFDHSFCPSFPIVGRNGNLQQLWSRDTPKAYISLAVPGMPNYFSKEFVGLVPFRY
jgi:cation diffusion facilitator CzcD-associated flavoprotein CzcO